MKRWVPLILTAVLVLGVAPGRAAAPAADAVENANVLVIAMNSTEAVDVLRAAGVTHITAATTPEELKSAWSHLGDFDVVTWSNHEFSGSYDSKDFITAHSQELLNYVKAGGHVLGVTRDDPSDNDAVLDAFGAHYNGLDTRRATTIGIAQNPVSGAESPMFRSPYPISPKQLATEVSAVGDTTFVESGLSTRNPALKPVALLPGTDLPAILAGRIGAGSAIFSGVKLLSAIDATRTDVHLVHDMLAWMLSH